MARVYVTASSASRPDRFRENFNSALHNAPAAHFVRRSWNDQGLHLSAPGAEAFVHFRRDRVNIELEISFPLMLMKAQIIAELRNMLTRIGADAIDITELS